MKYYVMENILDLQHLIIDRLKNEFLYVLLLRWNVKNQADLNIFYKKK